ncbi:hypothetical protein DV736_g4869, partial [Chaetothyriales sp. CBS 134916]
MGSSTAISDDDGETTQPVTKGSRRNRLKGVLSRTKTKFQKKTGRSDNADDDVEDFLAAGRNSSSTGRPSTSDSFASGRPSTSDSLHHYHPSPESLFHNTFAQRQPSPRRVVVPKIDVSHSQRWPDARPVPSHDQAQDGFLRPYHQGRSRSASSLSKGPGRARGLNVQFTNQPPVIIGEGGDEAQTPPIEISRIAARARSLSPAATPRGIGMHSPSWDARPPLSQRQVRGNAPVDAGQREGPVFAGIRRVQTGMSPSSALSDTKRPLEKEFEMSLGLGSASMNSEPGNDGSSQLPPLLAPKPIHPPAPYLSLKNIPEAHDLRSVHGTINLRSKFDRHQRQPRPLLDDDAAPTLYEQLSQEEQKQRYPAPDDARSNYRQPRDHDLDIPSADQP